MISLSSITKERKHYIMKEWSKEWRSVRFWRQEALACVGCFLYALGFCIFVIPQNFYSGGFTGIAQIIQTLLTRYASWKPTFDLTGIFLYIINIPLMILAWTKIGKRFFVKSLIAITVQSLFMSLIPVPSEPLVSDPLTCCVIGGLISGLGSGLVLRSGSSGGGTDIIGMYCTKKYPDFSVGKVSMIISAAIFAVCLLLYDLETVVYSAIYFTLFLTVLDRVHYQNIKTSAMVITKKQEVGDMILHSLERGVTVWEGEGGYTHQPTYIYLTVLSKYETGQLKRQIHQVDPHAFVIFNNDISVDGYFQKRL